MRTKAFAFWTWAAGAGFIFVAAFAIFAERIALTYTWHKDVYGRDGAYLGTQPSPSSFWFHLLWSIVVLGLAPIILAAIALAWNEEARIPWWRDRAERIQRSRASKEIVRHDRERDKDKARLRKLALIAAENEVYDSIREGRKVDDTTAALLRQAELDS